MVPLQDLVVGAGELAVFECMVAGPPDMDVDWLSRGRLLQPALLKCKMHFDGRKCKLLLTSVHEDDSGIYTCKLSTAKGKRWTCSSPRGVLTQGLALAGGKDPPLPWAQGSCFQGCSCECWRWGTGRQGDREWVVPQVLGRFLRETRCASVLGLQYLEPCSPIPPHSSQLLC